MEAERLGSFALVGNLVVAMWCRNVVQRCQPVGRAGAELGRGSTGLVRAGFLDGRPIAAKTPSISKVASSDSQVGDIYRSQVDSFGHELEVYREIMCHPGTCSCSS